MYLSLLNLRPPQLMWTSKSLELDTDLAHQAETAKYISVIGEKLTNTNEYFQNLIRFQTPFRVTYFSAGLRLAICVLEHHQDPVKPCSSSNCKYI
jgi:hypothetical protein